MATHTPDSARHASRHGDADAASAMTLGSRVWTASSLLTSYMSAAFEAAELNVGEADVLMSLRVRDDQETTPAYLKAQFNLSSPGITKRLDLLEGKGFLVRRPHPTDRRSVTLHLTPKGEEVADETIQTVATALTELSDHAFDTDQQRDAASDGLDRLIAALQQLNR